MDGRAAEWHISSLKLIVARIQQFLPLGNTLQDKRTLALLEKSDKAPDDVTISEIFELDYALHRLLPTQSLLEELPMLRLRYKEAIGERQYAVYRPFDSGSAPNFSDPQLRVEALADVEILLAGLYRDYALCPHREGLRQSFAKRVIFALIIYTAAWGLLFTLLSYMNEYLLKCGWPYLSVLLTVCYFGIIGGYVSFLRRTQSLPVDSDALLAIEEQNSVRDLLWSSPLSGAVFAIILLLLVRSALLGGSPFPQFDKGLLPNGIENYAKLCFWSFVAGFAERFVPNVLDRIIQKSSNPSKQKTVVGITKKR